MVESVVTGANVNARGACRYVRRPQSKYPRKFRYVNARRLAAEDYLWDFGLGFDFSWLG